MKAQKIFLSVIALTFSLASFSQIDSTKKDTTTKKTDTTTKKSPAGLNGEDAVNLNQQQTVNGSVSSSSNNGITKNIYGNNIAPSTPTTSVSPNSGSSVPKPNFGRYYIPVLGTYTATATTTENKSISVTGDENNPGKIWIEGLSGNKFYAILKSAPGTYKIPSQKIENANIAEGTVVFDATTNQINLCVGCGFNQEAPVATEEVAAAPKEVKKGKNNTVKTKKVEVINFTGTKADQGTVSILQ